MWSPTRSKCLHRLCPDADLADSAAKQVTELPPTTDLQIAFSSVLNVIKKVIRDSAIAHNQARKIYTPYCPSINAVQIITQEDEVLKQDYIQDITLHYEPTYIN